MVYYADERYPRKRLKLWDQNPNLPENNMEDFNSETDSDYTSYWRDWVSWCWFPSLFICFPVLWGVCHVLSSEKWRRGCGFCWTAFYATIENAERRTGLEHPRDQMSWRSSLLAPGSLLLCTFKKLGLSLGGDLHA